MQKQNNQPKSGAQNQPQRPQAQTPQSGGQSGQSGQPRRGRPPGRRNTAQGQAPAAARPQNEQQPRPQTEQQPRQQGNRNVGRPSGRGPVRIIPLGGLNEIGKNITLYEYGGDMVIVDCGMAFPDQDMPGVDIVIPDLSYVVANRNKIRGLVLTHGHEDHIGAIPYLLRELNIPVYGTRLTLGLVEGKLKEHHLLHSAKLNVVSPGDVVQLGGFKVEFIRVNHSIPDASALAITCGAGTVIQTGDFKIDTTPINSEMIDIARLAELGRRGVLCLLSDSTNAERPGFTMSERSVGESLGAIFKRSENSRIIVATFSSNIHRIQQIIDEAARCNRKVAVSGRSMINVVTIASELGYLKIPEGVLIDIDMIRKYAPEQLVIITTGSQGEPMSALFRMAFSDHRKVSIIPGDVIIISATPIPGNEKTVGRVINELMKLGADVIYEKMYEIHVSGHACQEELKLMLGIVKPKFFMPVHGETKHLSKHAKLGYMMGIPEKNVLIGDIGDVIEVGNGSIRAVERVPAGRVLVDGLGVGDVGSVVLRDRKHLAEDGIIIATITLDSLGQMVSPPNLVSRGFIYVRESEQLMDEMRKLAASVIKESVQDGVRDWGLLKTRVKDTLSKYVYERTRRSPMVMPIISAV